MTMQISTSEHLAPREKARRLLEDGIAGANPAVVRDLLAPDYRQHNPRVKDGPEGLLAYVEWLGTAPATERPQIKVIRTLVDDKFVVTHSEYIRHGTRVAGFDVFRLKRGKLAEHWDAGQPVAEKSVNGRDSLDGPVEVADLEKTAANKRLVRRFFDDVFVNGRLDEIARYTVDGEYLQHDAQAKDGASDLRSSVAALRDADIDRKRVIGEGNFVVVHSERTVDGKSFAVFDLFRVEDGKVAEHWDVIEQVPATSENDNGMF